MTQIRGSSYLERIIQHVVQALVVLAIGGVVVALDNSKTARADLQTTLAVTNSQLEQLQGHLAAFQTIINDHYTKRDADRDLGILHGSITDHEKRLRFLERRRNTP